MTEGHITNGNQEANELNGMQRQWNGNNGKATPSNHERLPSQRYKVLDSTSPCAPTSTRESVFLSTMESQPLSMMERQLLSKIEGGSRLPLPSTGLHSWQLLLFNNQKATLFSDGKATPSEDERRMRSPLPEHPPPLGAASSQWQLRLPGSNRARSVDASLPARMHTPSCARR